MELIRICVLGIIGVFLTVSLFSYKPEYGVLIGIVLGIFVLFFVLRYLAQILVQMDTLSHFLGERKDLFMILIKALGCCYVSDFTAGICKDAGCSGLAAQMELLGKLYLMVLALPVVTQLLYTVEGLY